MNQQTKLLIIDDDAGDRKLIQKAIEKAGFEVEIHVAKEGIEGIEKADKLRPEVVVVLDTVMPGLDGFDTCKKIKEIDGNIKVIICTGVVDAVDATKARNAGADDYCVKTADYGVLINVVKKFVEVENSGKLI